MFEDLEPTTKNPNTIVLGEDVSTLSLVELDERVALLQGEIERLTTIRKAKAESMNAAEAFFKKP
ncbi:DUF1192 domain-containing protein [Pseudahrensia aquimaris]|uniref:DUF1192 domain-containing protein n=1 Tax=Pseudahrensia aquimaris TaxID=744461 RepID=A0ABW3FFJ7_9HYPH